MKRATDVEKLLLSLPPSMKSFPVWISFEQTTSNGYGLMEVFCVINTELYYGEKHLWLTQCI